MEKVNYKIYPLAIVSNELLEIIKPKLRQLESDTSTEISFNTEERCFDIYATNQENCQKVEEIITTSLLPYLNKDIDNNYMDGTFEDPYLQPITATTNLDDDPNSLVVGRPPSLQNDGDDDDDDEKIVDDYNAEESSNDVIIMGEEEEYVHKLFQISPSIRNPEDLLFGPIQRNMQTVNYLDKIPSLFNVECVREGRNIHISGNNNDVQNAYNVFSSIQRTVIGQSKTILVPCIHYPTRSSHYGLFFCSLNHYRFKSLVHTQLNVGDDPKQMHVILPVFFDEQTQEYKKPKDLMDVEDISYHQNRYRIQTVEQLNTVMQRVSITQTSHTIENEPNKMIDQEEPSWGMDRDFTNSYNDGNLDYLSHDRLSQAFTSTPASSNFMQNPVSFFEDFPSLPSPTPVNSVTEIRRPRDNAIRRRVMRIVPQKASAPTKTPPASLLESVKAYNYHNIKSALTKGLESVRGFKGEIKLSARIGKVLWPIKTPIVNSKIWELEDITDIVVRELKNHPQFTTMTTMDGGIIDCITSNEVLPETYYNRTAIFEFHCSARNQPALPYKPIVLHMNQGVVDVRKVVISEKSVVEVDWVTLDRKYDFQLALKTKQLVRNDVKPYTTFIKWVSICPISQQMTFENVPNFLNVDYILFKQTTRYRITYPFVVEIVRIEKVPLQPIPDTKKINAHVGKGECWYDFQVYNILHDAPFQKNLDLEVCKEADWKVEEILNPNTSCDTITEYVKNMLIIIEKIEIAIKKHVLG